MNVRTRLRPIVHALLTGLMAIGLTAFAVADVVVLKDGRRIEGKVIKQTAIEVVVETAFGELTFPRGDVVEVIEKKTRQQIHDEKLTACKTADDFFALGVWCQDNKMKRRSTKYFEQAVELDTDHKAARLALGFVRYKDEWMTVAERDARMAADHEAGMKAKGLVPHEGQWVTPEEKEKLERGLVLYEGRWMAEAEAKRRQGLAEYNGKWYPKSKAEALKVAQAAMDAADRPMHMFIGDQAVLIGTIDKGFLLRIDEGLSKARLWFDEAWRVEPGLQLFGNRLAEFYVFDDDQAYRDTAGFIAERSAYVPEGWIEAVKDTHGFTWTDPFAVSSARMWNRPVDDLIGHCYHHMGHLMLNRLQYRGKLLPAWYEEGVASLAELRAHGRNAVFCRSSFFETAGSQSGGGRIEVDSRLMRDGSWRKLLKEALGKGQIEPFDKLAQREFSQLELVDIATAIAIVEWLESHGDDTLQSFHRELRRGAPPAPRRVIRAGRQRQDYYDKAFQAAVGMDFRRADAEWRKWFRTR